MVKELDQMIHNNKRLLFEYFHHCFFILCISYQQRFHYYYYYPQSEFHMSNHLDVFRLVAMFRYVWTFVSIFHSIFAKSWQSTRNINKSQNVFISLYYIREDWTCVWLKEGNILHFAVPKYTVTCYYSLLYVCVCLGAELSFQQVDLQEMARWWCSV